MSLEPVFWQGDFSCPPMTKTNPFVKTYHHFKSPSFPEHSTFVLKHKCFSSQSNKLRGQGRDVTLVTVWARLHVASCSCKALLLLVWLMYCWLEFTVATVIHLIWFNCWETVKIIWIKNSSFSSHLLISLCGFYSFVPCLTWSSCCTCSSLEK